MALVIGACVAALSISGCSAQSPEPKKTAGLPAISKNIPDGYDRWDEMNGGPADIEEMKVMAAFYGLDAINVPSEKYANEYVGVTQLEQYCVLGFVAREESTITGLIDLVILSRYNESYVIGAPALPPKNVSVIIDKYRPLCSGDKPYSEYEDGSGPGANA